MTDYDDSLLPPIPDILTADPDSELIREQRKILAQLERQRLKQARDKEKKEKKERAKKDAGNQKSRDQKNESSSQQPKENGDRQSKENGNQQSKENDNQQSASNHLNKESRDQQLSGPTRSNSLDSESGMSNKFFKSRGQTSPPPVAQSKTPAIDRKSSTEEEPECVFVDSETSNMDSTLELTKTPGRNGSRSSLGTDLSANSSVKIQLDSSTENEPLEQRSDPPAEKPQNATQRSRSSLDSQAKQTGRSIDKTPPKTKSSKNVEMNDAKNGEVNDEMKSTERGAKAVEKESNGEVTEKEERRKKKNERKAEETREETGDRAKRREAKESQSNQKENVKKSTRKDAKEAAMDQTTSDEQPAKARPKRSVETQSVEPASSETPQSKRRRTCTLKDDPLRFVKPVNTNTTPALGIRIGLSRRVSVKSSLHPELYKDLKE